MHKIRVEIYPYEGYGWSFRIVSRNVILVDDDQVWDACWRAKKEARRVIEQIQKAVVMSYDIIGSQFATT